MHTIIWLNRRSLDAPTIERRTARSTMTSVRSLMASQSTLRSCTTSTATGEEATIDQEKDIACTMTGIEDAEMTDTTARRGETNTRVGQEKGHMKEIERSETGM